MIYTELTTNGTVRTDAKNIKHNRSISENNSTGRVEATFDNTNGRNKSNFTVGDEVILKADKDTDPATTSIFRGTITNVSFQGQGSNQETIKITARDYTSQFQKTSVEPEVYTSQEVSAIVRDLFDKYAPAGLTRTNVVSTTGKTINRIVFKQITLFEALRQLADYVDHFFFVDTNKDLNFQPIGAIDSGVTCDNTNVISSEVQNDIDKVRNRVYVYGSRQLVRHPRETFTGDGAGSAFTLSDSPHNTHVTVSGADQRGGVLNVSAVPESGTRYLVDFHGKKIVFVSGTQIGYNAIPGSLVTINVDYFSDRPIIKFSDEPESVSRYGPRTEVIVDTNIEDANTAKDIAANTIRRKAWPVREATLELKGVVNVIPGRLVTVNLPNEGITSELLECIEARYDFDPKKCRSEKVLTISVDQRVGGVEDAIAELSTKQKKIESLMIDTTGILSRLKVATGSIGLKVREWWVRTRDISGSFIIGHPVNGIIGTSVIRDQRGAATVVRSGGTFA